MKEAKNNNNNNNINTIDDATKNNESRIVGQGYSEALLRTLAFSKVTMIRYVTCDVVNLLRCKSVPLKHLRSRISSSTTTSSSSSSSLEDPSNCISLAQVAVGGLPSYADMMVEGSGWNAQETLILIPDVSTLRILPYAPSTALFMGNLIHQTTGQPSDLCTRSLLQRVLTEQAARLYGIGINVGVELEFCLHMASNNNNSNNTPVDASTFASTLTLNRQDAFLQQLVQQLDQQDVTVELAHAESAPGQMEVVLKYQTNAVTMVDHTVLARETILEVAHQHGLKALFLPKIHAMKAGNGLHLHLSIYDLDTGRNLMGSEADAAAAAAAAASTSTTTTTTTPEQEHPGKVKILGQDPQGSSTSSLSIQGQAFMEGILKHLPALLAFTLPSANSFRRVGPGCWTGSQVAWAYDDKEASLRVAPNLFTKQWEHFEYKLCDSQANLYLALSAIILAGLQGIEQNMTLRPSRNDPDFSSTPTEKLPSTFEESLNCLEQDEYLMSQLPASLLKGYLALRRAEAARSANMTLEDEVKEALERA